MFGAGAAEGGNRQETSKFPDSRELSSPRASDFPRSSYPDPIPGHGTRRLPKATAAPLPPGPLGARRIW